MTQEKDQLYKEFEREIWLYLDEDLPVERLDFWKRKIDEFPELKKYVEDYLFVAEKYNEVMDIDLDDRKFNSMINNALNQNSLFSKFMAYLSKLFSNESEFAFGKIAFASMLIIGAIVISLISNRSNPVVNLTETINSELLDWDADFVDDQISKVGILLKVTKDEEYRKYYKYKLTSTSVDKNITLINKNIDDLKKEINNKNF